MRTIISLIKGIKKITAITLTLSLILSITYINPIRSFAAEPVNQSTITDFKQTTPQQNSSEDQNSLEDNQNSSSNGTTPTLDQGSRDNSTKSDISTTTNPDKKPSVNDNQDEKNNEMKTEVPSSKEKETVAGAVYATPEETELLSCLETILGKKVYKIADKGSGVVINPNIVLSDPENMSNIEQYKETISSIGTLVIDPDTEQSAAVEETETEAYQTKADKQSSNDSPLLKSSMNSLSTTSSINSPADGSLTSYLTNIVGRRSVSLSDSPKLADRLGTDEAVDQPSGGGLSYYTTDLSLPGKDGLDLNIGRFYNTTQAVVSTRKSYCSQTTVQLTAPKTWTELYMVTVNNTASLYDIYTTSDSAGLMGEYLVASNPTVYSSYWLYGHSGSSDGPDSCTSLQFKQYADYDNYLRSRYDLGNGWSFAFPSVQKQLIERDTPDPFVPDSLFYIEFHDGRGGTYEFEQTPDTTDSNLKGYQGKDVVFDRAANLGKSYSNNGVSAQYVYIEQGKKEYYFADDGCLIGIKDRLGNEIKFNYITRTINGNSNKYISSITDSIGRIVTFSYTDNPDASGKIDISVQMPGQSSTLSASYIKSSFVYNYQQYYWGVNYQTLTRYITGECPASRQEPLLQAFVDPMGKTTSYSYSCRQVRTDLCFISESYLPVPGSPGCLNDTQCLLTKIDYPNSTTDYDYGSSPGNKAYASDWGSYQDYVLTGRHDHEIRLVNGVRTEGEDRNSATYSNTGNYTYKLWRQPDRTYDFVTAANGVTTTETFNMKGQETKKSSYDGVKKVETTNDDWDNRFNLKARRSLAIESASNVDGNAGVMINRTFNDWGGLESYTDGSWGNHIEDRKQYYYYTDPNNKCLLTSKQWKQNATTSLSENYQYNSDGRLTKITDVNGNEINYSYSNTADGLVKQTTQALEDGKTAQTTQIYGPQSQNAFPTETRQYYTGAANGYSKTTITYNMLLGLPDTITDDAGNSTIYTYDNLGRVTSVQLPDINNYSVRQTYNYQPGITSPLFDSVNQNLITTLVDSSTIYKNKTTGQEQTYNHHQTYYNAYGQLILDTIFNNQQNTWISTRQCHYDSHGKLIYEVDALGNTNTYQFDGWGNLVSSTDPFGNNYKEDKQFVDNLGTVTDYFIAAGSSTQEHKFETYYDNWNRVYKQKIQPSGLTENYEYDEVDNIMKHTDPLGNISNYGYDKKDQLTSITDPLSQTTGYTYTRLGNLKDYTVSDGGQNYTTSYQYNELGQETKSTDPGGLYDTAAYNNLGLVSSSTDANGTTFTNTYDSHNRLTNQSGGGISTQYQYTDNPYGVNTIALNNGSSVSYSYDGLGRIASQTSTIDGTGSTVSYQYDNAGKITNINGPGGLATTYHYDKTRVDQVQYDGKNISYEYYPDGKIKTISYPALSDGSILKSNYEYDDLNRLTMLTNQKGTTILSQYQYTYDNNSNIKTITTSSGVTTYTYDSLNRLIQVQRPDNSTTSYTYDGRGNRKTSTGEPVSINTAQFNYSYNAQDQLTGVTISGQSTSYTYDPAGLRIKKTTPTAATRYTYDNNQRAIAETNGTQNSKYIWGPDKLLIKKDASNQEYYYIYNGHGDVVQIIDQAGNVVNNYEYDEWGNVLNETETVPNSFKYCGEIQDPETGFYYLRARYYDPTLGRFISKDSYEGSITNPLSLNLYTYCENDPIGNIDPSGKSPQNFDYNSYMYNYCNDTFNTAWNYASNASNALNDFIWRDDWNTLNNPNASSLQKGIAVLDLVPIDKAEGLGGKLLLKGTDKAEKAVIGKMADLSASGAIKEGEFKVADLLPNLGNPKANWQQNSKVLRQIMSKGNPIRDVSIDAKTGKLINNTGFLKAERNLLQSKGWKYNPHTGYWNPPKK